MIVFCLLIIQKMVINLNKKSFPLLESFLKPWSGSFQSGCKDTISMVSCKHYFKIMIKDKYLPKLPGIDD